MTTFVTILAATAVALPLVVLVLRGTRLDPSRLATWRPTRNGLGRTFAAAPDDLDAVRAAHDLAAVHAHQAVGDPARTRPRQRGIATYRVTTDAAPKSAAGRCIHLPGSTSGTKPNLV